MSNAPTLEAQVRQKLPLVRPTSSTVVEARWGIQHTLEYPLPTVHFSP